MRHRAGQAVMDDGFAAFRSDRVPGAGWISPLIGPDFACNLGCGYSRPAYL
ncbi:hypothetical protein F385_867 [Pantoea agglomerans 299R]|nr:hypothetical protein F385_867 [Pantoea agglomerans 299R]